MCKFLPIVLLMAITGCAIPDRDENVVTKNDAIDDYIQVSELKEVSEIRQRGDLYHQVVTEKYIILEDRRDAYLAAFGRRCRELDDTEVRADVRYDARVLRARLDTYRGCRIRTLYEVNAGHVQELLDLGAKNSR